MLRLAHVRLSTDSFFFFFKILFKVVFSNFFYVPAAGPASVTGLSIKTNSTNSLTFHWSPPEGDFESYELFLYRGDDSLQERRRSQASALQCSFQGLIPGALYRLVVVTHSGEHSNQSFFLARTGEQWDKSCPTICNCQSVKTCLLSSVPATVASLRVRSGNKSDTLWVNWDRGAGELSGYLLTLYNPNGTQQARSQLGKDATELVFWGLIPGRLYRAEVLSQSGELSNGASTVGRTGKMRLLSFS